MLLIRFSYYMIKLLSKFVTIRQAGKLISFFHAALTST